MQKNEVTWVLILSAVIAFVGSLLIAADRQRIIKEINVQAAIGFFLIYIALMLVIVVVHRHIGDDIKSCIKPQEG